MIAEEVSPHDTFLKLGDLDPVANDDGVLADQVEAADMAVQVDPDAGPVEAGGHLLDMGRLAGAMQALNHHPAVAGEAGQDRQGHVGIEAIGVIDGRHMVVARLEYRDLKVGVDAEDFPGAVPTLGGEGVVEQG